MSQTELKKIWLFTLGSRGDVQPYIAVGHALVQQGYDVTFFCNGQSFAAFAESYGCRGVALSDLGVDEFMKRNPLMMKGMVNGDVMTFFRGMNTEMKTVVPGYCDVFLKHIEENGLPDLCLIMPLTQYFGWYLAIRHKIPFMFLSTIAALDNPEHPPLGLPKLPFGLSLYLLKMALCNIYDAASYYDETTGARILQHYPKALFLQNVGKSALPFVVLLSPIISDVMTGYGSAHREKNFRAVGTTVLQKNQQLDRLESFGGQGALDQLNAFLQNGTKPVYLGWGSMISKSGDYMVAFSARAAYHSGQRAIVLGGFAGLSMDRLQAANVEPEVLEYAQQNILFIEQAPHEWLFPQVAVIVHHGGAGTTTAALRAGVPSIITPVFADQWDFSYYLRKTGVGIGFAKQFQKIDSKELGNAIRRAMNDSEMQEKASLLGLKLRAEDGALEAVSDIQAYWRDYCVTGKFHDVFPGRLEERSLADSIWLRGTVAVVGVALLSVAVVGSRRSLK